MPDTPLIPPRHLPSTMVQWPSSIEVPMSKLKVTFQSLDSADEQSTKSNNAFKPQFNEQNGSKLLNIAPEIRRIILTYLLKKGDPIYSQRDFGQPHSKYWTYSTEVEEAYAANASLSSQVLRVCQLLYVEGKQILYNQNTLSICYCDHRPYVTFWHTSTAYGSGQPDHDTHHYGVDHFYILDITITMTSSLFCLEYLPATLQEYVSVPGAGWLDSPSDISKLVAFYPNLTLIPRFRFNIDVSTSNAWVASRLLRNLFYAKDVTIDASYTLSPTDARWGENSHALNAFRVLRCRSVSFNWSDSRALLAVKSTITSQAPVYDTQLLFTGLWKLVCCVAYKQGMLHDDVDGLYDECESVSSEYDIELYRSSQARFLTIQKARDDRKKSDQMSKTEEPSAVEEMLATGIEDMKLQSKLEFW